MINLDPDPHTPVAASAALDPEETHRTRLALPGCTSSATNDVKIRIMGHFAIIHAAFSYTTPNGQRAHRRYTDCWAKQNGKWLAVSAHVTR